MWGAHYPRGAREYAYDVPIGCGVWTRLLCAAPIVTRRWRTKPEQPPLALIGGAVIRRRIGWRHAVGGTFEPGESELEHAEEFGGYWSSRRTRCAGSTE